MRRWYVLVIGSLFALMFLPLSGPSALARSRSSPMSRLPTVALGQRSTSAITTQKTPFAEGDLACQQISTSLSEGGALLTSSTCFRQDFWTLISVTDITFPIPGEPWKRCQLSQFVQDFSSQGVSRIEENQPQDCLPDLLKGNQNAEYMNVNRVFGIALWGGFQPQAGHTYRANATLTLASVNHPSFALTWTSADYTV